MKKWEFEIHLFIEKLLKKETGGELKFFCGLYQI